MVKVIYTCEVCGRTYDKFDEAKHCEVRKSRQKDYPIGLMFGFHVKNEGMQQYINITFAVESVNQCKWNPHNITINTWACNSNLSDNDIYSCSWTEIPKYTYAAVTDPGHPTFKRMVEFLQSKGITPTVWDGEKPISLKEHEKLWANIKKPEVEYIIPAEKNQSYMPIADIGR